MKAKRIYNPSRIVALVVIGVMLFGLVYIRFAPGDAAVSVPQGAHAGLVTPLRGSDCRELLPLASRAIVPLLSCTFTGLPSDSRKPIRLRRSDSADDGTTR